MNKTHAPQLISKMCEQVPSLGKDTHNLERMSCITQIIQLRMRTQELLPENRMVDKAIQRIATGYLQPHEIARQCSLSMSDIAGE